MVVHATFRDAGGWNFVLACEDGHCRPVLACYDDADLAVRLRDYLDNEARMLQLFDRHGSKDVPLPEVPS